MGCLDLSKGFPSSDSGESTPPFANSMVVQKAILGDAGRRRRALCCVLETSSPASVCCAEPGSNGHFADDELLAWHSHRHYDQALVDRVAPPSSPPDHHIFPSDRKRGSDSSSFRARCMAWHSFQSVLSKLQGTPYAGSENACLFLFTQVPRHLK